VTLILVIGGRSKIGAALITELLDRGEQVRALVRAGEAAGGQPPGSLPAAAEAVTGDLADEGSLVAAMAGIEKVFLLSSPHPDAAGWHRNAIDAARRTQVQLMVRSSILGAGRETPAEFVSAHIACDRYLEDSGLPYVIVRPNCSSRTSPNRQSDRSMSRGPSTPTPARRGSAWSIPATWRPWPPSP
jgi:uncharacterized protein YbjT (DUF2867 family)